MFYTNVRLLWKYIACSYSAHRNYGASYSDNRLTSSHHRLFRVQKVRHMYRDEFLSHIGVCRSFREYTSPLYAHFAPMCDRRRVKMIPPPLSIEYTGQQVYQFIDIVHLGASRAIIPYSCVTPSTQQVR